MFREPFPILRSADVEQSVDFFCDNFGFELAYRWPVEGALEFAGLRLGGQMIGIAAASAGEVRTGAPAEGAEISPRFELCLYTDDTDRAAQRLLDAGVKQLTAPADMPWGDRLARFEDPDGNAIQITARRG